MAELERAQAILTANQGADDEERSQLRSAYEQATAEVERLQASLAETQSAEAEILTQLRAEHDQATAEVERLQTTLVEAETQHAQELGRLRDAHDRVTAELDKLLASIPEAEAAAASEQERLLAELTQLESNRAEAEAAHTQELAQLRDEHEDAVAEIERLQTALAETRTADEQELVQLRGEHERATAEVERLQTTLAEAESAHAEEVAALERAHAHATAELETLRTTIDAAAAAVQEQERLGAELAEFQAARAEADTVHEQELSQLREAHAHATAEVERLQTMLAEEAREQATAETERLQGELTVLEQAHTHALAELETLRTTISAAAEAVQEQERLRAELAELEQARAEAATVHEQELAQLREEHEHATAEIKRLQESFAEDGDGQPAAEIEHLRTRLAEIESAYTHATSELETLRTTMDAAADAVRDREQLRAELAELESAHAEAETIHEGELAVLREAHAHATAEIERLQTLLADAQIEEHERARVDDEHAQATAELERLQATLAELEASHARDLAEMREAHGHATAELERLQGALAEAETTASNHAEEKKELVAQRDRLQRDLAESLERLESLDAVVRNRDELRAELEQLRAGNSDAQEALLVADRVRESQIVLEAERDRALAELERVEVIANEAQSIAEEQTRLLAEERTRHESERESLLAQHTILEAKLHDALDRLGAAAALADERGKELQLAAERLHNALGEEPEAAPADEGKRSKSRRRQKTNIEPAREPNAREGAAAESEDTKSEAAADESAGVETDLKDGATGADNPTTYPNWRPEMDEYFDSETVFDDTFAESNGAGAAVLQSIEDEVGSPAWGKSLDRVLGLFDSETTRLHELRGKLTGLGREMATREARIKELEAEVQRFQIERLRDQEMVDRLKHELAERNNRLERALASTQELSTIIQGGQVR
jgi:DNA repair exonuclease SbcCD ATPase subunit